MFLVAPSPGAKVRQRACSRVVAWLALVAMLLSTIGFRIGPAVVRSGERFPCENCACACGNAATCWSSCCCHSDEEKLAWAARHQVEPPKFVVARLSRKLNGQGATAAVASCCRSASGHCSPNRSAKPNSEKTTDAPSLLAAGCGAAPAWFVMLSSALPTASPEGLGQRLTARMHLSQPLCSPPALDPPVPPPKLG